MSDNQRPKRLTAHRKFELYLETRAPEAPIGDGTPESGVVRYTNQGMAWELAIEGLPCAY